VFTGIRIVWYSTSTPGLERMARYLAFFVKEVAAAAKEKINP